MISSMSIVTFVLLAAMNCIKCNPVDPNANGHSNGQQTSEDSLNMDNLRRYLNQIDQETQNSGIMRFGRSDRSQLRHGSASEDSASEDSASEDSASQDFEFIRKDAPHDLGVKSRMEQSEEASYSGVVVTNDDRETFSEVSGQSLGQLLSGHSSSGHLVKRDGVVLNDSINPVSYDLYDRIMFLKSLMKRQQAGKKPMKPASLSSTHVQAM